MQYQQKNNIRRCNTRLLLLPITGTLFIKKPAPKKPSEESTLDFHFTVIKKIDELLREHDKETPAGEPTPLETPHVMSRSPPVEPRPQLGRRPDHIEIDLPHLQEPIPKPRIIPEEFKTDPSLCIEPEFRFITSLDSLEHALHFIPQQRPRIEVIDLGDFTTDDIASHLTTSPTKTKTKEPKRTKKIEVIDMRAFTQQSYKNVFQTALKQNEEIEKKSQIYYLNSADHKDAKIKRREDEQSYVPEDFEERAKVLKEQQEKEEQEKQKLEEQLQKQREKEQEKQIKFETKKSKPEEKEPQKKKERTGHKKEPQPAAEPLTTKQLKEQKQLHKIEARKALIEERQRKKQEKRAFKEQQKQQRLKQSKKNTKQKPSKTKQGTGFSLFKKEKPTIPPTELDEEIKKVLIMTDTLLGELPEDIINRFAQSDDFELYERVLNKYKIK
jgi:hypothetical protein